MRRSIAPTRLSSRLAKSAPHDRKNGATIRFLLLCALCLIACPSLAPQSRRSITRNVAWNQLCVRLDHVFDRMQTIRTFLKSHESEVRVNEYDVPTFRAIDESLDDLKVAEKDLKTIRDELEYREQAGR